MNSVKRGVDTQPVHARRVSAKTSARRRAESPLRYPRCCFRQKSRALQQRGHDNDGAAAQASFSRNGCVDSVTSTSCIHSTIATHDHVQTSWSAPARKGIRTSRHASHRVLLTSAGTAPHQPCLTHPVRRIDAKECTLGSNHTAGGEIVAPSTHPSGLDWRCRRCSHARRDAPESCLVGHGESFAGRREGEGEGADRAARGGEEGRSSSRE